MLQHGKSFDWDLLVKAAADRFLAAHGKFLEEVTGGRTDNLPECVSQNLACIVFSATRDGSSKIVYISHAMQKMNASSTLAVGLAGREAMATALMLPRASVNSILNGQECQRVAELHAAAFALSKSTNAQPVISLLVSCSSNEPCWNLSHAFPVASQGAIFVVHVHSQVPVPIPGLLWPKGGLQESAEPEFAMDDSLLQPILARARIPLQDWKDGVCVTKVMLSKAVEHCQQLERFLGDALEGDHFVPRLGGGAVASFQQHVQWSTIFSMVNSDLKACWAACDMQSYMIDQEGKSVTMATAVADVNEPDCPLVYVSPGFETLTGYQAGFAQGRNCRFLQPNQKDRNEAFNGPELRRMRAFCTQQRTGQIFVLLLNESRTGEPFWNLLFMKHLRLNSNQHYIFGLQTNIELQKNAMDKMLPLNWTIDSLALLARMRDILKQKEDEFQPSERCFAALANEVTAQWILEVGQAFGDCWEGGHYCPKVGHGAMNDFVGKWPELANLCLKSVLMLNKIQEECNPEMMTEAAINEGSNANPLVCAVSDPSTPDCPLVYITESFTTMTGYDANFALGRNCRFLQPNDPEANQTLNGDELARMRAFCKGKHEVGETIINLLLNETFEGVRFWNLLHMTHVDVGDARFILAVQTNLRIPMPRLLKHREVPHYEVLQALEFSHNLGTFLDELRRHLRANKTESDVSEGARFAIESILAFMKENDDDYAGDQLVPRLGRDNVELFSSAFTWPQLLSTLAETKPDSHIAKCCSQLDIHDRQGSVAIVVIDLTGPDCPIVDGSRAFQHVTGYPLKYALGRNFRFMLPKIAERDTAYNSSELTRLEDFLGVWAGRQPRLVSLLLLEGLERIPFWGLRIYELVKLEDRPFLLFMQSNVRTEMDQGPSILGMRLAELQGMDEDSLTELARFRHVVDKAKDQLVDHGWHIPKLLQACVESWSTSFPSSMELPWSSTPSMDTPLPIYGLELTADAQLPEIMAEALLAGVRHFHLYLANKTTDDVRMCELEGRLLALKLAQALSRLHRHHYNYILRAVVFTLRTPPKLLDSFKELRKTLKSYGLKISYWLLDATATTSIEVILNSWGRMSDIQKDGEVGSLGLYGASRQMVEAVQRFKRGRLAICASEFHAGMEADLMTTALARKLQTDEVQMLAYNVYGPRESLLQSPTVKGFAAAEDVDPRVLLLKCIEARGWSAIAPSIPSSTDPGATTANSGLSHMTSEADNSFFGSSGGLIIASKMGIPSLNRSFIKLCEKVKASLPSQLERKLSEAHHEHPAILNTRTHSKWKVLRKIVNGGGATQQENANDDSELAKLQSVISNPMMPLAALDEMNQSLGPDSQVSHINKVAAVLKARRKFLGRRRSTGSAIDTGEMQRMIASVTASHDAASPDGTMGSEGAASPAGNAALSTRESDTALRCQSTDSVSADVTILPLSDRPVQTARHRRRSVSRQASKRGSPRFSHRAKSVAGNATEPREEQQQQQQQQDKTPFVDLGALERPVTSDAIPKGTLHRRKSAGCALACIRDLGQSAGTAHVRNLTIFSPYANSSSNPRGGRPKSFSSGNGAMSSMATRTTSARNSSRNHINGGGAFGGEQSFTLPALEDRPHSRATPRRLSLLVPTESGKPSAPSDLAEAYGPWLADKDLPMGAASVLMGTPRGSSSALSRPVTSWSMR
mmetsp:Transcript_41302/g.81522  ORF Transcript_41302/g.81522 Transcript_41302/m.81522 type:complete len:1675 (+) Transcript_41302:26-5050(+)